jgi:hypothetical protein
VHLLTTTSANPKKSNSMALLDLIFFRLAAKNAWASIYGKDDEMAGGARSRCV